MVNFKIEKKTSQKRVDVIRQKIVALSKSFTVLKTKPESFSKKSLAELFKMSQEALQYILVLPNEVSELFTVLLQSGYDEAENICREFLNFLQDNNLFSKALYMGLLNRPLEGAFASNILLEILDSKKFFAEIYQRYIYTNEVRDACIKFKTEEEFVHKGLKQRRESILKIKETNQQRLQREEFQKAAMSKLDLSDNSENQKVYDEILASMDEQIVSLTTAIERREQELEEVIKLINRSYTRIARIKRLRDEYSSGSQRYADVLKKQQYKSDTKSGLSGLL